MERGLTTMVQQRLSVLKIISSTLVELTKLQQVKLISLLKKQVLSRKTKI